MKDLVPLGKILKRTGQRDAIHIAVAPVTADEDLKPGQMIGLVKGSTELVRGSSGIPIGIVDPFLFGGVKKGDQFYMLLMPNTVTSMRHQWTHPAFGANDVKSEAENWLRGFANTLNMAYDDLLDIGQEALQSGGAYVGDDDSQDMFNSDKDRFLECCSEILGIAIPDSVYFSCAC